MNQLTFGKLMNPLTFGILEKLMNPLTFGILDNLMNPLIFGILETSADDCVCYRADDCVIYREIKDTEDILKLQKDIDQLGCWARKWGMRFQPVKCNIMQITRKRIKKIYASYTLEGTVLENIESIKYLGVTITNDSRWKNTRQQYLH